MEANRSSMRICRFIHDGQVRWGIYKDDHVVQVDAFVAAQLGDRLAEGWEAALPVGSDAWQTLLALLDQVEQRSDANCPKIELAKVTLLPPVARPPKLLLLAGNYAEHVREQGGTAAEKSRTFPYVFMKPPSTTLIGSGTPFQIPHCSPEKIDHEVELAVVIGKTIRDASVDEARAAIAGYTVINDISDRGFRPNPNRESRPRDTHFDWLHGKWHDGSCPCGPCMLIDNPQIDPDRMRLTLSVDGTEYQCGTTEQMVFTVSEVIQFISSFVTLEPGDIISTGTPSGVGNATGRFLKAGQTMTASVEHIGSLITPLKR